MNHYVCTGTCGGVSDVPKVCGAETCSKFKQDLATCGCVTGQHEGMMRKCENCSNFIPMGKNVCAEGKCNIETGKPA